ncbi:MAG: Ldh family oxidoreductase [Bacillota bacterium]
MKIIFSFEQLYNFSVELMVREGLKHEQGEVIAENLLEAELRGVVTHGLVRLPVYMERAREGGINKFADVKVIADNGATMILDGNNTFGQIVGKLAMGHAIEKAQKYGISFIGVRNSNHFGIAAYYSSMAIEHSMIGFSCSNASPRIAPSGGASKQLGNNPISLAFPVLDSFPIVIDMALSVAAAGKIRIAAANNEKIPLGWAIDKVGRPTEDAISALEGFLLPIGGHKGYALAFAVDLLCGMLTGSAFGKEVGKIDELSQPQRQGHVFGAIRIENFMSMDLYKDKVACYIDNIKGSKKADGSNAIYLPGELEWLAKQRNLEHGLALPVELVKKLNAIGEHYGLKLPI